MVKTAKPLTFMTLLLHAMKLCESSSKVKANEANEVCLDNLATLADFLDEKANTSVLSDGSSGWLSGYSNLSRIVQFEGCFRSLRLRTKEFKKFVGRNIVNDCAGFCGRYDYFCVHNDTCYCLTSDERGRLSGQLKNIIHVSECFTSCGGLLDYRCDKFRLYRYVQIQRVNGSGQCLYISKESNGSVFYGSASCHFVNNSSPSVDAFICQHQKRCTGESRGRFCMENIHYHKRTWKSAFSNCSNGGMHGSLMTLSKVFPESIDHNRRYWIGAFRAIIPVKEKRSACLAVTYVNNEYFLDIDDCNTSKVPICKSSTSNMESTTTTTRFLALTMNTESAYSRNGSELSTSNYFAEVRTSNTKTEILTSNIDAELPTNSMGIKIQASTVVTESHTSSTVTQFPVSKIISEILTSTLNTKLPKSTTNTGFLTTIIYTESSTTNTASTLYNDSANDPKHSEKTIYRSKSKLIIVIGCAAAGMIIVIVVLICVIIWCRKKRETREGKKQPVHQQTDVTNQSNSIPKLNNETCLLAYSEINFETEFEGGGASVKPDRKTVSVQSRLSMPKEIQPIDNKGIKNIYTEKSETEKDGEEYDHINLKLPKTKSEKGTKAREGYDMDVHIYNHMTNIEGDYDITKTLSSADSGAALYSVTESRFSSKAQNQKYNIHDSDQDENQYDSVSIQQANKICILDQNNDYCKIKGQ